MIHTHKIPIIEINAMENIAGCLEKINIPKPINVVSTDRKMEREIDFKWCTPLAYFWIKPSIVNMQ